MPILRNSLLAIALSFGVAGVAMAGHGAKSKDAGAMIDRWPDASKKAAKDMIRKYGQPDEITRNRLIWHDNGIWERTVVNRDPTLHLFPKPHHDVLEQVVHMEIDPSFVDELTAFDGSLYVDRTRGEISARCDQEAANLIALNLAHDLVMDDKSVDEAREDYALHVAAMMRGEPTRYSQALMFEPDPMMTADPDETILTRSFLSRYEAGAEKGVDAEPAGLTRTARERTPDLALPVEREDVLIDTGVDRPPNIVPKDDDFDEQWEQVDPGHWERKEPQS